MEIIVGKSAGFCYGVRRAVESAKKDATSAKSTIYCLGEIVHNKEVVSELENDGIKFIENMSASKSTTIIRAHGVPKEIYEQAEKLGIELRDYTCPNVLKIHKLAEEYSKNGYFIILYGSKKHPENIGTISFCGEHFYVVENEKELFLAIDEINRWNFKKVVVLSQTTFSLEKFYIFNEILQNEINNDRKLEIRNTICKATEIRQIETAKIAKTVDLMIIIGGKNSSNTKKLFEIASKNCKRAICIETQNDINFCFIKDAQRIGIMAGASTPQKSIDDVCQKLNIEGECEND